MYRLIYFLRILILWTAGLTAGAQFSKISLFLPELEQAYPDAGSTLGFLVSVVSLIGALFGLIAGTLAPRVGLQRLLFFGLAIGAVVSIAQSSELSLMLLLASRILEGVSHLAIVIAAPTLIAQCSSDRYRSTAMTLWSTFFGVSFAITGWFGLPLVETQGITGLFLLHGALMAVIAVIVLYVIPENDKSNARIAQSFSLAALLTSHKQAWTSPAIAAPATAWLFYTITFVALLAVLPGMMATEDRAFTATALPISSIGFSLTLGVFLLRRMSAVRVVRVGFIIAIPFVVLLSVFPAEPLVCIGLFAALGLVQSANFASIPQLNKSSEGQALANGTLAQAGNLGNLIGTPMLLSVVMVGGVTAMSALVIVCYILGVGVHMILTRNNNVSLPN